MKKIIFVLIVIAASLSCEREKCKECTTVYYYKTQGLSISEGIFCGASLETMENRLFISTDPITGETLTMIMTKCK